MGKNITIVLSLLFLSLSLGVEASGIGESVLASGKWYRFSVTRDGIHQITGHQLDSMGIDISTIDPLKIRMFGNGSGMLPELNSAPRTEDLREISVQVVDGGDGHFDAGDYFLFYGESSDKWVFERLTRFFTHQRNLYSDTTYYYFNFDQKPGKRVTLQPFQPVTPDFHSSSYDYPISHELDLVNLIRSGKEWYGELFDNTRNSLTLPFTVPDIDNTLPVRIKTSVVGKSPSTSYFVIWQNGQRVDSLKIDSTDPKEYTRAGRSKVKLSTLPENGSDQTITITYTLPTDNTTGWLNFADLTARRHSIWMAPQMNFRDVSTISPGRLTRFTLAGTTPQVNIWDITDPGSVREVETVRSGDTLIYILPTDSLREFIAFDGSGYLHATYAGTVPNQNLRAHQSSTLVIITPEVFREEADELAAYHRQHNNITVQVTGITEIYHEFSCGQPDPTAIRDYIRMLYLKGTSETRPKYLLLFGDGSYDPKNRVPGNNNLIPTYQSIESLNTTTTYVTDDYFGIMSATGGQDANGAIEIGIGRFPVSTREEAQSMVSKIKSYSGLEGVVRSDWRNVVTFVADDENSNLHMQQAEELVSIVNTKYPVFNTNKIYFDAYQMEEIPGGQRFPGANAAINQAVDQGTLIMNYTGHGGESGWSYEQVLTTADILSWKNKDKLPVFVTATCEFSRFDNPERYTAGEMLINQPGGGAIALYSTTRLAFAGDNIMLNKSFFNHLMDKDVSGQNVKMGDLIRLSKNENQNKPQLRNFVLLGDPAQNIAFPEHVVVTKHINTGNANFPDTVKGLSMVTVNGQIENMQGEKLTGFNGKITCKVFDKPVNYSTLGNRPLPDTYPAPFTMQNSLLFSGEVPVDQGEFWVTFPVPRGIALPFGRGKLSYYAIDSTSDAAGYNKNIIIGGSETGVDPVNPGPDISLWIDSPLFINGSVVSSSPVLFASLADTSGINWYGLGIGHEILMTIDDDLPHATVLNNYFTPWFSSFSRGSLEFPLPELAPGTHKLTLKAWDLFDNSSVKSVNFTIPQPESTRITHVVTAPNPMTDYTRFIFSLDPETTAEMEVKITIYNIYGVPLKNISSPWPVLTSGIDPFAWDGSDETGKRLPNGIYPYRITFSNQQGVYYQTTQKLMIVK